MTSGQSVSVGLRELSLDWMRRSIRSGAFPLLIAILSVQGFSALAQLIVARAVTPTQFGVVRAVEAFLAIMLLIASAGMPSLAIRDVAAVSEVERPLVIGRLLSLAVGASISVAFLGVVAAHFFLPAPARPYLIALIWSIVLTSVSRTGLNYFQGVGRIPVIARLAIVTSVISFCVLALLVNVLGLRGWILGRYVGECLLFAATLLALRGRVQLRGWLPAVQGYARLFRRGMVISMGLIVRTVQDNIATMALAWLGATRDVGYYGLAVLILTPLLLLPGILSSLALPRFVHRRADRWASRQEIWRFGLISLGTALGGAVVAITVVPPFIYRVYPEYAAAIGVLGVLVLSVPLRAVALIPGAFLTAHDRNETTVVINLVSLAIAGVGCLILIPRAGAVGAGWAMVIAESCVCVMCVVVMRRMLHAKAR